MNIVRRGNARRSRALLTTSLVIGFTTAFSTFAVAAPTARAHINAAIAAGDARHYVKIVSVNTSPGQSQTITSQAGPGIGIQVLTSTSGGSTDHMTVELVHHTLYVKADLGFLEGTFGLTSGVATPFIQRWAVVEKLNPSYRNVLSSVTITSAMSFLAGAGAVSVSTPTVVNGVNVNVLRVVIPKSAASPSGTEMLYISRTGPPLPVGIHFVGSGYSVTERFSQWGKSFTVHAPTTSLRLPGAQAA